MRPVQFDNLKSYLAQQEKKSLLRFLTCGSVDDGKSTLIGRLLFDSKLIFEDHLSALAKDSRKHGTTGEDIDLALLVDVPPPACGRAIDRAPRRTPAFPPCSVRYR